MASGTGGVIGCSDRISASTIDSAGPKNAELRDKKGGSLIGLRIIKTSGARQIVGSKPHPLALKPNPS
jgi:hypothetical protein